MDFKTYVQNVVATYVSKGSENILFIKHYNTLDISKDDVLAQVDSSENDVFLYHEYEIHYMHSPFAPFLQWIKQCYNTYYKEKMSVKDFLKASGVYPVQLEVLTGYIEEDVCKRTEDFLYFEISYERDRMEENIISILDYISKEHHLILIISKFHLAPFSTIRLMRMLVDRPINIHAILMYNDEFAITEYKKKAWSGLMQEAERQDLQLEWGSLDSEKTMDVEDEFWYVKNFIHDYFLKLRNLIFTFALEDAYYYMNNIMNRLDEKTVRMDKSDLIEFHFLAAWIDMHYKQHDLALAMCDKLTDLQCHKSDDFTMRYMYFYTCAKARLFANQVDSVRKYAGKAIQIARGMGSRYLECRARVLIYVMESSMGKDLFEYEFNFKCSTDIVEQAQIYGLHNFLAYIYVFGFDNDKQSLSDIYSGKKEPYYFNLAIDIGLKLDNKNFILNAYMKNIIQFSQSGYYSYVGELYQKRLKVLGTQSPVRQAHMLAGLGYNSVIMEEYELAHSHLEESVDKLLSIEQNGDDQPMDIMNSLYNVALIDFVAENYRGASDIIELIMKMLKELNYNSIRASSNSKLFMIIAMSSYYLNEFYNSYFYLSKIEIIFEHMIMELIHHEKTTFDEDAMLYHLVKGTMFSYEGDYQKCISEFKKLKKISETCHSSSFLIMPHYYIELCRVYLKLNMPNEAEDVINEGIQFCEQEKLFRKKERLIYFKEHHAVNPKPMLDTKEKFPVDEILQITRRVGIQLKLTNREKDIMFLTVLQEAISRENLSVNDLYVNTTAVIKNRYNLDKIIILRRKNGKIELVLDEEGSKFTEEDIVNIFEFFRSYKQAFLSNRVDKNFTQFEPITKSFYNKPTMTVIGIPMLEESGTETIFLGYLKVSRKTIYSRTLLDTDDLMILKFAFSQFCEMMRRIDSRNMIENMNKKLEQSAVTDYLTGITNRTGFGKHIQLLCTQGNHNKNVLLYFDLDNFKFYNDTFGHDVGDLVLVTFAELIKRMTMGIGLAVRYGGDEFIVLLYDKDEDDGVEFAKRVYEEISGGFINEIKAKLKHEIFIPDGKKISCSIGITSFKCTSKSELEDALIRADQMLYYVKKHGKSTYKVYDPSSIFD